MWKHGSNRLVGELGDAAREALMLGWNHATGKRDAAQDAGQIRMAE
jgi:hypothetical protein